ncbi:DUF2062 domain-containing protein [Planctomycetota bacterium]
MQRKSEVIVTTNRVYNRTILGPIVRFVKYHILHIDDSAHRIAMGVAIGLFVGWTPLIGLHTLIVLPLALLVRANKFVAIAFVWVTNVFTAVPIYYFNYLVGRILLGSLRGEQLLTRREVAGLFRKFLSFDNIVASFCRDDFLRRLWTLLVNIRTELWVGSLIIGSAVSVTAYFVFYRLIKWHRKAYAHNRFIKHQ